MKRHLMTVMALLSILLAACGSDNTNQAENKLDTEEMKTLVHDYTTGQAQAESASITSTELIVTDEQDQQTVYDLPEDEFFVSIAPFKNQTHDCDIHSLTGCQGELMEQDFDVEIVDTDGNMVLNESKQTEANGFIDLWLPRDETYTVTISQDGQTSEAEISTFDNDNTCITTMQLS